jgi:hypothetical protein
MATVNGKGNFVQHSVYQVQWLALATGDVGTPEELSRFPMHSVQFGGTFGGATVVWEGSNDGVTYFTMTGENPAGGADALVSATSAARFDVTNVVPQFVRPRVSGGSSVAIDVTVIARSYGH